MVAGDLARRGMGPVRDLAGRALDRWRPVGWEVHGGAHSRAASNGLTAYHYDYHDARGHEDRRIARRVRLAEPVSGP